MNQKFSASSTEEERRVAESYHKYLIAQSVTNDEIIERYDQTSEEYEKNVLVYNFSAHIETAVTVSKLFPNNRENVYILDIAAGTGLCAVELRKHGFQKMDGLDASKPMLEKAKRKGVYGRYIHDMLGDNILDIENDTYDVATISSMSFEILKKLPVKALEEVIRVVKPGGYIINTCTYKLFADDNAQSDDFRCHIKNLEAQGKWKMVEVRIFGGYSFGGDGGTAIHRVC